LKKKIYGKKYKLRFLVQTNCGFVEKCGLKNLNSSR
jgi:hypothetical protein